MEAIREIRKVKDGHITVDLPARFRNIDVEIIVLPFKIKQTKANNKDEVLLTSESALKKDWNLPVEDKAWQNL